MENKSRNGQQILKWTKNGNGLKIRKHPTSQILTEKNRIQKPNIKRKKRKIKKLKTKNWEKKEKKIKSLKVEHKNKVPIGPYLSKFLHSKKEELYVTNTKTSSTTKFYVFYFDYWRKLRLIDMTSTIYILLIRNYLFIFERFL